MRSVRNLIACLCSLSGLAQAADVSGLYEAAVEPSADRARDSAFVEAFRMVAIKVSGVRTAAENFSADLPNIRNNVQLRAVRPDGAVTIRFDDAWVDRTLTAAGLPIWGRERPAVLVWLSVPDASGKPQWISADKTSPERDAIERAARRRGLPIVWPQMDVADTNAVAALAPATRGAPQALLASGERYRADAVLLGLGTRDASGQVSVRWTFALQGAEATTETQGNAEEGIEHAADRCASLFAVPANARADVLVSITGIQNLDAYAAAMSYLQGITLVRAISVEQLAVDTLRLRVAVRGDAAALRRAIELKRRGSALVVDAAGAGEDILRFRYLQ